MKQRSGAGRPAFSTLPARTATACAAAIEKALSAQRQADVSVLLVERLPERHRQLALSLLTSAPAAHPSREALRQDLRALLASLSQWRDRLLSWRVPASERRRLLEKTSRRLEKARASVLDIGIPVTAHLHSYRVALKTFRYRLEIVAPWVADSEQVLGTCRKLQKDLGEANDWAALLSDLREACSARQVSGPKALHASVERERDAAERAAVRAVRRSRETLRSARLAVELEGTLLKPRR